VKRHPMSPWTDVTFAGVYWQEEKRLPKLLSFVRPWFKNIVVGVQEGSDKTLEIARKHADIVVEDAHHGYAEPTFSKVLERIKTPWTFVVSGDEMPSWDLLDSFQSMLDRVASGVSPLRPGNVPTPGPIDGLWIPFRSTIDGIDFTAETDGHVRVFRSDLWWPTTMHSGPQCRNVDEWRVGSISHDRSLDEMVKDYLSYFAIGKGNPGWDAHNLMMMREACKGVAATKGWEYVKAFPWWGEVEALAFG
jgi:hypothetical protein